jgi:hypothetical protein
MSSIPETTQQAYRETHFRVYGGTPMTLEVGQHNKELAHLYGLERVQSCAFITSCNPYSQPCDDAANAARQAILASELEADGLVFIDGMGQHPSNERPGEASYLVLDLSLENAKACGTKHEQNAIVWCGADAVPQLVLLR